MQNEDYAAAEEAKIWLLRKEAVKNSIDEITTIGDDDPRYEGQSPDEWEREGLAQMEAAENEPLNPLSEIFMSLGVIVLYEHWQMQSCKRLLDSLQDFLDPLYDFFLEGFYGEHRYLEPSKSFPPRYVLRTLLDQVSIDLKIVQSAMSARLWSPDQDLSYQGFILYQADILCEHALRPAFYNGLLKQYTPAISHFEKNFTARLIPYENILFVGIPYTTMVAPSTEDEDDDDFFGRLSRDFLAIPHEVGHFIYWNAQIPDSDEYLNEYLDRRLEESKIRTWDWRRQWLEEIFSDVYSCLVAGPVVILDMQDLLTDNLPGHFREDPSKHPIPVLRPFIQTRILTKIKTADGESLFKNAPKLLDKQWRKTIKTQVDSTIRNPLKASYYVRGAAHLLTGNEIIEALDEVIDLILEALQVKQPPDDDGSWKAATWTPFTTDLKKGDKNVSMLYDQFVHKDFSGQSSWREYKAGLEAEVIIIEDYPLPEITSPDQIIPKEQWEEIFLFRGWSTEGPETDIIP